MPETSGFNPVVTAATYIRTLMEQLGLMTYGNRAYDAYANTGTKTILRPRLPKLTLVKNTGTASGSADRKGGDDGKMVSTTLGIYNVPFKDEIANAFASNMRQRTAFLNQAAMRTRKGFDEDFCAAIAETTNDSETKSAGVAVWEDVTDLIQEMTVLEIPLEDRLIIFPATLQSNFLNIDVIKNAIAFNYAQLNGGKFTEILGHKFFVSVCVPQTDDGKDQILGCWGPGVASILSQVGHIEEVWDPTNLWKVIDVISYAAFELDDNDFAVRKIVKAGGAG